MNQKRLLIVSTVAVTLKGFLLPFASHFRAQGWKVDGAAKGADDCLECRAHFDRLFSIDWSRSPGDLRGIWNAARRIRSLVAANNYDIVHVHTPIAAFVTRAALAGRKAGGRPVIIYTAHGFHFMPGRKPFVNLLFASAEKIAGFWTDYLITINRTDESAARRLRLVPGGNLRYMPGIGIDRARFSAESVAPADVEALRRMLALPPHTPAFVMIAEFGPNKRHTDVIAAFSSMKNTSARLLLVGDGPLRPEMEHQAAAAGIRDRVHFAGAQEDVRPWIVVARALVLASFREGLPRSIMEALSCGVPVIGTAIRGVRDLLSDGGGRLFSPGDVPGLAAHLDWFADNPEAARALGAAGREHMAKYDIAHILALHDELYATAMRNRAND